MSEDVVKKKVKPYPIEASVVFNGNNLKLDIQRVNLLGMIVDVKDHIFRVKDKMTMTFQIPVSKHLVQGEVVVWKTYDQVQAKPGQSPSRYCEFHFTQLGDGHKRAIAAFTHAIGQED